MSHRLRKWRHRWFGTVADRRRLRDRALRHLGLARSHLPWPLVGRDDLMMPGMLSGGGAEILLRQGELTFVQVGAFDGRSDDDLTSLLAFPGVNGVLIEPQPEPFAQLQRSYGGHRNLHLSNVAIAPVAGVREFFRPRTGQSRLASFDRSNLVRHGIAPTDIVSTQVTCVRLDALLAELRISRVDVLQIDAEGYDLEVLGTLDLDQWQPQWIRFEHLHLPQQGLAECLYDLSSRGYRFLVQERDILASRRSPVAKAA